ncbi:transcriptional regulator, XRE family with cupin sensor [Proteiniborus ethanoligenes]|uniref:Transcriptional regulator, XRE family with cupin sensor n=2 Tax=Proteiniborus ethanoligenes TaxID=415015 RepID=A0A1H3LMP5_9FIRM|nr:transcriptional regulator, XRE family with cupin sensor [Proteiniborus ethanoligenes]
MIKSKRLEKKMSLRELGIKTGLSASAISQIENNKSIPNILTAKQLADVLGFSIISFFLDDIDSKISLVRKDERKVITRNKSKYGDLTEEMITKDKNEILGGVITIPPLADSGKEVSHNGEEIVYILEGEVMYTLVGVGDYILKEGDTLTYPCSIPHKWKNTHNSNIAKILLVATSKDF